MKVLDIVIAVLLICLGLVHCVAQLFNGSLTEGTMWSLGAGLFFALVGALNLLRVRYGAIAFGVRAASAAANLVLLGFSIVLAGALGIAHRLHSMAVVGVVLAATLLSFWPAGKQARAAER